MTCSDILLYAHQKSVTVAVEADPLQLLGMSGALALNPEVLSRPAPVGDLAGLQRPANGLFVHVCKHHNLPLINIKCDGRDKALFVKFKFTEIHGLFSNLSNGQPAISIASSSLMVPSYSARPMIMPE